MVGVFAPQRRQRATAARIDHAGRDVGQRQQHERVPQLVARQARRLKEIG
jgi:hypothetical protein